MQTRQAGRWTARVVFADATYWDWETAPYPDALAVTPLDGDGQAGPPAVVQRLTAD